MTDRPSPIAALTAFFIAFFGIEVFEGLIGLLLSYEIGFTRIPLYLVNIGFQCVFFAVPAVLYYRKEPEKSPALRLQRLDPLCMVLIVLAACVGMLGLNWISIYWTLILRSIGLRVSTGSELVPRTFSDLGWLLFTSAIAPGIFEEVLFRGFLMPSLEPQGSKPAVLLSGVMFAMLHGRLEALPSHLLLGVVLAVLVLETGSLFASMCFHMVYNAMIVILAFVGTRVDSVAQSTLPTLVEGIRNLPAVLVLLSLWVLMLHGILARMRKRKPTVLPPAERKRLPRLAVVMLVVSGVLLVFVELRALLSILPEKTL